MHDLTVVVCLYNARNYIIKCLDSLSNQSYKRFKLLIINDSSTDDSLSIVEDYLAKQSYLEYAVISLPVNKGTAYTRNYALSQVKSPLMLFFDADDIASPALIEKLITRIKEDAHCIAVSCHSKYIDTYSNHISGGIYLGPTSKEEFFWRAKSGKLIFMPICTLFNVRYAINAGGFVQEGFPNEIDIRYQDLSEDLDLWSRMSDFYKDDKYMITIPEVLFYYRKNTSSLSSSRTNLFAMQGKIRYVKFNLKRRRKGLGDITYIEYANSEEVKNKKSNFYKDISAYYYRQAGFYFVKKSYLKFIINMILSFRYNPKYILNKVKYNIIHL